MKQTLMQATIIVAIAVGGLAAAGPAAAQSAQEGQNFGSHVSHCARMGGFSGEHNPSMMKPMPGTEPLCQMPA